MSRRTLTARHSRIGWCRSSDFPMCLKRMVENRMYVRKYYRSHRDQVMLRKTERACRLHGRVPRAQTVLEHDMPMPVLVSAFKEWVTAREPDDRQRAKRISRFRELIVQLRARA